MSKLSKAPLLTASLLIIVVFLLFLNIEKTKAIEIEEPNNIVFDKSTNTLDLNSLTLKQKIAQMIVTYEKESNKEILQKMFIGGIHLGAKPNKNDFIKTINNFQNDAIIPFFITVDMEGCLNPFSNFQEFPALKEIKTEEEAYQIGYEEGKLLKELGFNINFAPVVDLEDNIWKCRSFIGTPEEISNKANAYIIGLQENEILATSKHYPGKTLNTKDLHKNIAYASIDKNDLLPFEQTISNNVDAIMITHTIVKGNLDSESKPSVTSESLVNELRNQFTGLIITDDIRMLGLRDYYEDPEQMYIDLFKADNDIILNFNTDPKKIYHMILVIENAVINGEVSEERIDNSVIRILKAKGIEIKN